MAPLLMPVFLQNCLASDRVHTGLAHLKSSSLFLFHLVDKSIYVVVHNHRTILCLQRAFGDVWRYFWLS